MNDDNDLSVWKSETYSVVNASLLACNVDPSICHEILNSKTSDMPKNFWAYFTKIKDAINSERLKVEYFGYYCHAEYISEATQDDINWYKTRISHNSLVEFFERLNIKDSFFNYEHRTDIPPYMNPKHKFYSKEIHAVVELWMMLDSDPNLLIDKTPSEAIQEHLEQIGKKFKLSKRGLSRIAIVANWKDSGRQKKYTKETLEEEIRIIRLEYPPKINLKFEYIPPEPVKNTYELDDDIPF